MGQKPLTTEKFIKRSIKAHGNIYDYTKSVYINALTKVKIGCKIHGEFLQDPNRHMRGKGCIKCGWDKSRETQTSKFISIFINRCAKIHKNKYDYSKVEYKNMFEKIIIICPIHGEFKQVPNDHLRGGCYKCNKACKLTKESFIEKAINIHGNKYNYDIVEYKNSFTKVKIICYKHGAVEQMPGNHLFGNGCGKCNRSVSKPEILWLNSLNVPEEYRNKLIKIKNKSFKVDGFDPNTNTIYEFYGDYWHGNPKIYKSNDLNRSNKKSYGYLYNKTITREDILTENGFNIISIWEYDWKNRIIK